MQEALTGFVGCSQGQVNLAQEIAAWVLLGLFSLASWAFRHAQAARQEKQQSRWRMDMEGRVRTLETAVSVLTSTTAIPPLHQSATHHTHPHT